MISLIQDDKRWVPRLKNGTPNGYLQERESGDHRYCCSWRRSRDFPPSGTPTSVSTHSLESSKHSSGPTASPQHVHAQMAMVATKLRISIHREGLGHSGYTAQESEDAPGGESLERDAAD